MLLLALLSCDPAPVAAPQPTAEAPAEAVVAATSTPAAPELAPLASQPRLYGETTLVILSSSLEPGAQPAGLEAAASVEGASLARLDSTWFKGLMPCYEIVVAGGFADKAQARAVSAALKARGVEHYLKPAGAYVGPRPELDAACAALRSPPAGDSRVLFVDTPGVRLPLDPAVAERVLDGVPALAPLDAERSAWGAALPVRTVDRWTVGDVLVGLTDQGAAVDCPITGFAAGVVGTPHWGWVDQGGGDRPACGSTEVYATVDCGAAIVLPAGSNGLAGRLDPAVEAPRPEMPQAWEDELTGLRALGNETGQLLQEQWTRQTMQWGERQVELWHLRLWTGEGEAVCGGSDYLAEAAGLLDLQGRPLTPLLDTTLAEVLGVVAVDQAPALHLREVITGSQRVVGDGLAIDQGRAYCDCPC